MLTLSTLRRLVVATLVAVSLTLMPAFPAAASPVLGWTASAVPATWTLLWRAIAQVWEGSSGSGVVPEGAPLDIGANIDPEGSPLEIGSNIDPHG